MRVGRRLLYSEAIFKIWQF